MKKYIGSIIHVIFTASLAMILLSTYANAKVPEMIKLIGAEIPMQMYIPGLGAVDVDESGVVQLQKIIKEREEVIGKNLEVGKSCFIPATDKTNAMSGLLEETIKLSPAVKSNKDYVLRVFHGPQIVNEVGEDMPDAKIWFIGYSGTTVTHGGNVNPSVYMDAKQDYVNVAIFKSGYQLQIVEVKITDEALKNAEIKLPLADSDIVLEPEDNRVLELPIKNYTVSLYVGGSIKSYYAEEDGKYFFVTEARDKDNKATYIAKIELISAVIEMPKYLDLEESTKTRFNVVDRSDLPRSIPRIIPKYELNIEVPAVKAPSNAGFDDGKTKYDYKFLAVVFIVFNMITIWVIWFVRKKAQQGIQLLSEKMELEKYNQQVKLFTRCRIDLGILETIEDARRLINVENLNKASKQMLEQTISNISKVMEQILNHTSEIDALSKVVQKFERSRVDEISNMGEAFDGGNYDIALSQKQNVEDIERQIKSMEDSINSLSSLVEDKRTVVAELAKVLKKMSKRARALINQVDTANDLSELNKEAQDIYENIKSSLAEERNTFGVDAQYVKDSQHAREKAQKVGINIDDVDELKEFLSARK